MSCSECAPYGLKSCPMCRPLPIECPLCGGTGYHSTAYDIREGRVIEVTPEAYVCLPDSEDEAIAKRQHYCKCEMWRCEKCDGTGVYYPRSDDDM